MSQQIHILPEQLCNQIAAGEVVERPASVIKELVENSLDAGADEILIEVEQGGARLLRVSDNGRGMSRDDAFLALERHATSKIRSEADLSALLTLGFRGEALPSIASVSRLTLRTCDNDAGAGTEIALEGGTVRRAGDAGLPQGTIIEVRQLFFNTPARRKFMRRTETEFGHIAEVVTRQALARPEVQFRLVHNGKTVLEARREGRLEARVADLLGRPLLRQTLPVEREDDAAGYHLGGLLGEPSLSRATSGHIYTFINGRFVRDRVLQHAVLEGYRDLLERGRYPVAVLFLELAPGQVDVNVHPTKHEVRFQQQRQVHDFVAGGIRQTLKPSAWLPPAIAPAAPAVPAKQPSPASPPLPGMAVHEPLPGYRDASPPDKPPVQAPIRAAEPEPVAAPPAAEAAAGGYFSNLRYIGQLLGTYLVAEDGQGLVLIDQHAAHERITFERLRKQLHNGRLTAQQLLLPQVMEFDFTGSDLLAQQREELARLGFVLEPFGGRSWALQAVPQLLVEGDAEALLRDVTMELERFGGSSRVEQHIEELLQRMACHGSVRAHQRLDETAARALLRELDTVDFKAHCPHGRPVMQRLERTDIERMFRRL